MLYASVITLRSCASMMGLSGPLGHRAKHVAANCLRPSGHSDADPVEGGGGGGCTGGRARDKREFTDVSMLVACLLIMLASSVAWLISWLYSHLWFMFGGGKESVLILYLFVVNASASVIVEVACVDSTSVFAYV